MRHKKNLFLKLLMTKISGRKTMPLQIDITNACNLRCTHCYHSDHKNKGAISLQSWFKILDDFECLLDELCLEPRFIICGGEPLTSPKLIPILERIKIKWGEAPVLILTNGTIINDKILDSLKSYKVSFQISLDGPNQKSHDEKRGRGNFYKSINGINLASKFGFDISLQSILSQKSASEIESFFQLAVQLPVNSMNFVRFVDKGYGQELSARGGDSPLYGFRLKSALEDVIKFSRKYKVATNKHQPLFRLLEPASGANGKFGFEFIVDYKGNMKVSSRIDYKVGNLLEQPMRELFFNHPVFKKLRKGKIEGCGECSYYSRCGGDRNASFAKYGHFFGPDPGCWVYGGLDSVRKNKILKKAVI